VRANPRDTRSIEALVVAVQSSDPGVRFPAARALGKAGPAAVDPLIVVLGNKKPQVRNAASRALGDIGDPRAIAPLIRAMRGMFMAGDEVDALTKLGPASVDPLIASLKDRDEGVRRGAIMALGKIKDPRAVEALFLTLKTGDFDGRSEAAGALGSTSDPGLIAPLIAALKEPDNYVRHAISEALAKFGAVAVDPLIAALKDANPNVRQGAARALASVRDPRAEATLLAALVEQNRDIVWGAYPFYIWKRVPRCEDFLIKIFSGSNRDNGLEMANDYLNSGNPRLQVAAERWAHAHGIGVIR
jgi:HEAT repeat protein